MKIIAIDVLFGVFTIIGVTVIEFLVTLPFGEPGDLSSEGYSSFISREFLLTALPAGIVTFLFTMLLRSKRKSDSLRRAVMWAAMLAVYYVLIGFGNDNLSEIFSTAGIYVLLAFAFAGPLVYALVKRQKPMSYK